MHVHEFAHVCGCECGVANPEASIQQAAASAKGHRPRPVVRLRVRRQKPSARAPRPAHLLHQDAPELDCARLKHQRALARPGARCRGMLASGGEGAEARGRRPWQGVLHGAHAVARRKLADHGVNMHQYVTLMHVDMIVRTRTHTHTHRCPHTDTSAHTHTHMHTRHRQGHAQNEATARSQPPVRVRRQLLLRPAAALRRCAQLPLRIPKLLPQPRALSLTRGGRRRDATRRKQSAATRRP
jgi:hypothetical protein